MENNIYENQANAPKIVEQIMSMAIQEGASDIHFGPKEDYLWLRLRIDGKLVEKDRIPKSIEPAIISRLKILSKMDIAEKRIPQDGRFRVKVMGRNIDFRVSSFPTVKGEKIVIRLLDESQMKIDLTDLGFEPGMLGKWNEVIYRPNGMVLVTGPTGSGKTSTLYSSLNAIKDVEKNIVTLEDPVEYQLEGIDQGQINPKAGFSFAAGLRSILRQDPDIIMVGEMRDLETVNIAIQGALTGHLVFSTLHTNNAPATITRLMDMGVEPFLISASVIGVLAQRLIRKVCDRCKEEYFVSSDYLEKFGIQVNTKEVPFYRGRGCEYCNFKGTRGRAGIFELMLVNDLIRDLIIKRASEADIRNALRKSGMVQLLQDGIKKALSGIVTLEEVLSSASIA